MSKKPLVSIVIPVYNGSNFLEDAIVSVLNQSYKNLEIIVVNDGSNDNHLTRKIAEKFTGKIKYFEKENRGVASALNFGIKKSTGSFFCWLSHDDIFLSDKIKNQLKLSSDNSIIFSDFSISDELLLSRRHIFIDRKRIENMPLWLILNKTLNGCTIFIPMTILRKHKFNESLLVTQDYDLWFRLSLLYPFVHLRVKTIVSRQHKLQHTNKHTLAEKEELENLYFKMVQTFLGNSSTNKNLKEILINYYLILSALSRFGYLNAISYAQKKIFNLLLCKSFIFRLLLPFISLFYIWCLIKIYLFIAYRKIFTSRIKLAVCSFLNLHK